MDAEQLRLRREQRKAKILQGAGDRLAKITGNPSFAGRLKIVHGSDSVESLEKPLDTTPITKHSSETLLQSPSVARTPISTKTEEDIEIRPNDEPIQIWTLLRLMVVLLHVGLCLFYYVKQNHEIVDVKGYQLGYWLPESILIPARKIANLAHEPSELDGILQFGQVQMSLWNMFLSFEILILSMIWISKKFGSGPFSESRWIRTLNICYGLFSLGFMLFEDVCLFLVLNAFVIAICQILV